MMKRRILALCLALVMAVGLAPVQVFAASGDVPINASNFPDAIFRQYVTESFDADKNGVLSAEERNAVTEIDVRDKGIASLDGIDFFKELEYLNCAKNMLVELDLQTHTNLEILIADNNYEYASSIDGQIVYFGGLERISLPASDKLIRVQCALNQLTALDVSKNKNLQALYCGANKLTSLNISKNQQLIYFDCSANKIKTLNLENNPKLEFLCVGCNPLTEVNLSNLTRLEDLRVYETKLTSLDLSENSEITYFDASHTQYAISVGKDSQFDLSTLPGSFNVKKASNWSGGSVSGTILTVDPGADTVTYDYDCGNSHTASFSLIFEPIDTYTPSLNELTTIDYLAFSDLSYTPVSKAKKGMTVRQLLERDGKNWNDNWKSRGFKYHDLYGRIANWTVYDFKEDNATGLGVYAFTNGKGEYMLAYRGSVPLSSQKNDAWFKDWVANDIEMFLGGKGSQVEESLSFAEKIVNLPDADRVDATGHSLGGGLCEMVSARFACYAETFNPAPFLDTVFVYYPKEMADVFQGVDQMCCNDHIVDGDLVGGWGSKSYKNAFIHKSAGTSSKHSLTDFLKTNTQGALVMTDVIERHPLDESVKSKTFLNHGTVLLGTTTGNKLSQYVDTYSFFYGGNGNDTFSAVLSINQLIGGQGNDQFNLGRRNDTYYYCKGDGIDTISDSGGNDKIYLLGFENTDEIKTAVEGDYVVLKCNGETIIKLIKKRHTGTVKYQANINGKEIDITEKLEIKSPWNALLMFACPVNIEIYKDETGEVVRTVYDGQEMAEYGDFGYYHVFLNEEGAYVKAIDLFEGYSLRVVGYDEGTMDVSLHPDVSDDPDYALVLEDVPVTSSFAATVEQDANGNTYLAVDHDGDGTADERLQLVPNKMEAVVIPPILDAELPFDDVATNDWFYDEVQYVYENGLMSGTGYRTFAPQSPLTRGMVWTILARIEGVNTAGSPWYAAGQAWAVKNGISDGTNPMAPITREQLAATLYRAALYWERKTFARADLSGFADAASVSAYAVEPMQWAVGSGIIGGANGKLNPRGNATRAEAAAMLMRFQLKT